MAGITSVNMSDADLNLLHVVRALLEERSATRAAARLHVTQSAVSNALRRARELFRDALVVRTGRGFAPTPRAAALLPELQGILDGATRIINGEQIFQPERSERRFTIACTDVTCATLMPKLTAVFQQRLPRARLRVTTVEDLSSTSYSESDVDLFIGVAPILPPGCNTEVLFEDPTVLIVRSGHPMARRRMSVDDYVRLSHLDIDARGYRDDSVDQQLAARGLSRRVVMTVPYFTAIPAIVGATDLVATTTLGIAISFANFQLRILKPPFELPSVVLRYVWHRRVAEDSGVAFLRSLIRSALGDFSKTWMKESGSGARRLGRRNAGRKSTR